MRLRATLGALLCLPALAAATPLTWDEPAQVQPAGVNSVARFDPLGNLYLLSQLQNQGNWVFAIRPSGGSFGSLKQPPPVIGIGDLQIGFDAIGNAVFAWIDGSKVKSAYRAAGEASTFGTVQTIGPAVSFDLSVNPSGESLLVWDPTYNEDEVVKIARRPPGAASTFGAPVDLATSENSTSHPLVILDPAGSAVVVWSHSVAPNPPSPYVQQVFRQAFHAAAGGELEFGPSTVLVALDNGPIKAQNAAGRAVLAFSTIEDIGAGEVGFDIQGVLRESGETFGLPVSLGEPASYDAAFEFSAAVGPRGDAGVAWLANATEETCAAGALRVGFAVAPPGSAFGASTLRGEGEDHANHPAISFDGQGVPLAVWDESIGSPCGPSIDSYQIRADLGLTGISIPLNAEDDTMVRDAAVARDAPGNAFVVWTSSGSVLRGNSYDAALSRGTFESAYEGWSLVLP